MLDTTYVTPEVAAEMLGTSVEMVLLAGAEGRIQFYGLNAGISEVEVVTRAHGEELEITQQPWYHDFLPICPADVADVIRTGTTVEEEGRFFLFEDGDSPVIKRLLPPKTLSFPRHCLYVRRGDIQAIIDSKQTPPASSVPSGEAVMQLSSQKARAANNDSRILAGILDHFKIDAGERGIVTLAAVLAHFRIDAGKRGLAKEVAYWTRDTVSIDTVRDRLERAKELLDKKAN